MLGVTVKNLSDDRWAIDGVFGVSDWNEWAISSLALAFVMDLGIILESLGSAGHTHIHRQSHDNHSGKRDRAQNTRERSKKVQEFGLHLTDYMARFEKFVCVIILLQLAIKQTIQTCLFWNENVPDLHNQHLYTRTYPRQFSHLYNPTTNDREKKNQKNADGRIE